MKSGPKPVRKCNRCLLNLGNHCWIYTCPRHQWIREKCPGFENNVFYNQLRKWQDEPHVKTRKQIRQELFRSTKVSRRLNYANKQTTKR